MSAPLANALGVSERILCIGLACAGGLAGFLYLKDGRTVEWMLADWILAYLKNSLKDPKILQQRSAKLPNVPLKSTAGAPCPSKELVALSELLTYVRGMPVSMRSLRSKGMPMLCHLLGDAGPGMPAEGCPTNSIWYTYPGVQRKQATAALWFHGGGYVCGTPRTYSGFTTELSKILNAPVLAASYRLLPENSIEDAVEDAILAYRYLLDNGYRSIVVIGESAGGGLCLLAVQAIIKQKLTKPACVVAMSPWADLRSEAPSVNENKMRDLVVTPKPFFVFNKYVSDSTPNRASSSVSPLLGDFKGFPPLKVTVGESEVLRDDVITTARNARRAGVVVDLEVQPYLLHSYPVYCKVMPEGREALQRIKDFIAQHVELSPVLPALPDI
ncbi:Acetyl-hydrolase [Diplonema papillatum]|nr:Acetyl-hydrolase [Diplonema papillatum]